MNRNRIRILVGSVAFAVMTSMATMAQADTPADTLMMAEAIDGVTSFDPAEVFEVVGGEVSNNIYLRLVTRDEKDQTKLVGGAAESWDVSEDGLTLTFKMRDGLTFASGEPVTAADAAFSLQRVVKLNKTPAFILTQFGWTPENVDQMVQATSAGTLVVKLTQPISTSLVLSALSAGVGAVVDKDLVMSKEKDNDLGYNYLKTNSAGAGAYVLRDWKPNEVIVLEANEKYFQGPPILKRVIIRNVTESTSQRLMLEKGDIDIARNLGSDQLKSLATNPDINIDVAPKGSILYLGMNTTLPLLQNPQVQEAIRLLVDYEGIASTLLTNQYKPHQSVLASGSIAASDDMPYSLNIEKAKALLAEAGYENGFSIDLDVYSAAPYRDIAEALQADFAKAGIKVNLVTADRKQALTKYRARNHQLALMNWSPDYGDPSSTIDFFVSNPDNSAESTTKTAAWRNGWLDKKAQELAQQGTMERDMDKRIPLYTEIQRILRHESPMVVMFQQTEAVAMRANVQGWNSGPEFDTYIYRGITK